MMETTPKRFAGRVMYYDLQIITGYWNERWEVDYLSMTDAERDEVQRHLEKFEDRMLCLVRKFKAEAERDIKKKRPCRRKHHERLSND